MIRRHREIKGQIDPYLISVSHTLQDSKDEALPGLTNIFERVKERWRALECALLTRFPDAEFDYPRLIRPLQGSAQLTLPQDIRSQFPYFRDVLGDGNCFYTSFTIGYIQWLCQDPDRIDLAISRVNDLEPFAGQDRVRALLRDLFENRISCNQFIERNSHIFAFISFLRHCAAHQMSEHFDDYSALYTPDTEDEDVDEDPQTIEPYITERVLKMGCYAQDYEISAIAQFLNCQIWVVDQAHGLRKINEESGAPVACVVYRNNEEGHYSFLQPSKSQSNCSLQ